MPKATKASVLVFSLFICLVATANQDCDCLSHLVYDVVTTNHWPGVSFLNAKDEAAFSLECIFGRGLPHRLWESGLWMKTINYALSASKSNLQDERIVMVYNNSSKMVLDQASANGAMSSIQWLILAGEEALAEVLLHAETLSLFLDSNLFVFVYADCRAKIHGVYRVGPRGGVILDSAEYWDLDNGLTTSRLYDNLDKRRDFHGYPMQGVGVEVFDFFTTYLENGKVSGFVGDIVSTLMKTHNFTLTYKKLEGYAYGKVIKGTTNDWTGMVGELQNRRADLTVSELSVTKERNDVITYTQPIYIVSRKLFVATQEDFKKKLLAYTSPMEMILYWAILVTMLGLAFFLVFIVRLRKYLLPHEKVGSVNSLGTAVWCMTSALLQQGCDTYPTSMTARMVFWFGFFVSVIVYTSYSATLVSHLAVEKPATLPFSNLFELSLQDGWDAGCNENDLFQVTATQTCANSPTEECRVLNHVWNKVVMRSPGNLVTSYSQGLQKVLEGQYVFIGVDVTTNYYIRGLPPDLACRVKALQGRYLTGGIAIGLQHNSPFRKYFDNSLQKLRETGLMNKLIQRWLSAERSCNVDNIISAGMADVATLFIILLMGTGLSVVFFAGEVGWSLAFRNLSQRQRQSQPAREHQKVFSHNLPMAGQVT
ncbi:glutamate receptor ionotropic, delta-1-like [Penaeus japonicus]|uniref:glutamate receptor ionotropic, delta-1-like n=1 Tax=Penaeus japonicus TaxID=27405 RepID=UPI001C713168|nr:glutamate receptor ionotropic, delta-1-like [Penaeus japonicus]